MVDYIIKTHRYIYNKYRICHAYILILKLR